MDVSTIGNLEEFCEKLKIKNALELFRAQKLILTDILNLTENDVNELIPISLLKERLLLREFLKASKNRVPQDTLPEVRGYSIDLLSLLKAEARATHLLQGSNKILDSLDANLIAKVIVNFWRAQNIKPTRSDFQHAFVKIKNLFKAECISNWIGGSTKGRGLLHNKVYNENKLWKKHQKDKESGGNKARKSRKGMPMVKRKSTKVTELRESVSCEIFSQIQEEELYHVETDSEVMEITFNHDDSDLAGTDIELDETNIQGHLDILKNNLGPIDVISTSWNLTYTKRQGMKYSVGDFKALQSCEGHILISNDFDKKFKTGNALRMKFPNFKKKVLPFFKKNIRDSKCKDFIKKIDASEISENSESLLYLYKYYMDILYH